MKYARHRARLVALLKERGITHEGVLGAIGAVERHAFMGGNSALYARAYKDEALPIGEGQTISQPFTVAYQTALLDPQPGDRILEVGTGSGYQAAVLAHLGARVFSIERHAALLAPAQAALKAQGYRVRTRHGDGTQGWAALAPFDGIVVTAGGASVPEALKQQLREPSEGRPGGRLVIPVGTRAEQTMLRITRTGPDTFETETLDAFRFVPLVDGS